MEYISAEEFLKQPKRIRKAFMDWWKCDCGDLCILKEYYNNIECDAMCCNVELESEIEGDWNYLKKIAIPLFTEGQLRRFIEDKTNEKLVFDYYTTSGYRIVLYKSNIRHTEIVANEYDNLGKSLIQAYWKVATQIAKEC